MVDRGIGGSPLDVLRAPEAIGTAAGTSNTLQTVQKKISPFFVLNVPRRPSTSKNPCIETRVFVLKRL